MKTLIQSIGCDWQLMLGIGRCDSVLLGSCCPNTLQSHQSGNGVFAAVNFLFEQDFVHARRAVVVMTRKSVNAFDFGNNLLLFLSTRRGDLVDPSVVALP
jgi:hypothetical protein